MNSLYPDNLYILNIKPRDLSDSELEKIIYLTWYNISLFHDPKNKCIGVPIESIGEIKLKYKVENNFNLERCKVQEVNMVDKKWNEVCFYV